LSAWYNPPASSARLGRGIPTVYEIDNPLSMSPDPFDFSQTFRQDSLKNSIIVVLPKDLQPAITTIERMV